MVIIGSLLSKYKKGEPNTNHGYLVLPYLLIIKETREPDEQ